jgi:23S rRNA pseudouridine2605 synthase
MVNSNNNYEMRIAKFIARSGFSSRRDAEKIIIQKRVQVNGNFILSPALNVTQNDVVKIDGKIIEKFSSSIIYLYHKPKGLIVSKKDEKNRPTVFSNLPKNMRSYFSVGRLDKNSSGLLLLTNDGTLSRFLELPINKISRKYLVQVDKELSIENLKSIRRGLLLNGFKFKPIEISKSSSRQKASYSMSLVEGKNREIRNIMAYFKINVIDLVRTSYGPYSLGKLKSSEYSQGDINLMNFN